MGCTHCGETIDIELTEDEDSFGREYTRLECGNCSNIEEVETSQ